MSYEVNQFLNSPAWEHSKQSGARVFDTLVEDGVFEAWNELMVSLDPEGATHAYKVWIIIWMRIVVSVDECVKMSE